MSSTTITTDQPVATLVNVFTVDPEHQQELVDLLVAATDAVMRHQLGFVSANFHASLDGTKVVNYAQWKSPEDFRAMLDVAEAQKHMKAATALASSDPNVYRVVSVHHA